ncbi:unnamed protein product [Spodoptera littoralis]|uniref:Uncharacterized protein n=1 Tax=Spodoptera littoralis TaxID=7109 RepID=A0A9P0I1T6_SPOLI|nr:unnamed protein product [Spodoptera littoralis]CAH1638158.1 unnamed protein product [Spodoptera littoralis]
MSIRIDWDLILGVPEALVLLSLVSVVTPGFQFRSRNASDASVSKPCALGEYTSRAQCTQSQYKLVCKDGLASYWMRGIK